MDIELHHLNTNDMMEQAGKVLDGVVRLKARIAELEEERRWRKCSEELPKDGAEVLATDGEEIWLCHKDTMCDGSPWFQPYGLPHIEGVTHWLPLPSAPILLQQIGARYSNHCPSDLFRPRKPQHLCLHILQQSGTFPSNAKRRAKCRPLLRGLTSRARVHHRLYRRACTTHRAQPGRRCNCRHLEPIAAQATK